MDLFNTVYKNKKILITGDTGFKGSWLCIWLKELGADVYGYALPPTNQDNFITTNLASKIHHIDGDIRDKQKLENYFNQVNPVIAIHLAAQPLVIESYSNPHYNFETNVMGTVNFFEAVRNTSSIKVAINVTTDKCYQNIEHLIGYKEEDSMGGDDPYSASKGCSELITNSYLKSFFLKENTTNIASARAGNVVGGGDWAAHRIIPDMMRSYKNKEVSMIRNPQSVRPWQFVLEPLFGYLKLGEKLLVKDKSFSGGWNFGPLPNQTYTVNDVVNEVKRIIPSLKTAISPTKEKLHEAKLLQLNINKAVSKLGWKPRLNFEETIQFTIDGYLKELENINVYQARVEQIKAYCSK